MALTPLALTRTSGAQLRLAYDATNYADFTTSSGGDLTIAPQGGDTTVTGTLTISSDVIVGTLRRATSDGADSSLIQVCGGGAAALTRGAIVNVYGNEHASQGGRVQIYGGSVTNGYVSILPEGGAVEGIRVTNTATATQTALMVYDVDNATLERVTVGAADSGGAGFKVLRIPN